MKTIVCSFFALCFSVCLSPAASVFWSFQTDETGEADAFYSTNAGNTRTTGFVGTPKFNGIAGGTAVLSGTTGGTSFFDPVTATTWVGEGSGGTGSKGNSYMWGTDNTLNQHLTGTGFRLTLDLTGLTDLQLRFDIRAASNGSTTGVPTGFSTMEYRIGGTGGWTSMGLTSPTWSLGSWQEGIVVDMSSLDAIEGQANVEIRFVFNASDKTSAVYQNVKMDNLYVTAVPEPAAVGLLALGGVVLGGRRRR